MCSCRICCDVWNQFLRIIMHIYLYMKFIINLKYYNSYPVKSTYLSTVWNNFFSVSQYINIFFQFQFQLSINSIFVNMKLLKACVLRNNKLFNHYKGFSIYCCNQSSIFRQNEYICISKKSMMQLRRSISVICFVW